MCMSPLSPRSPEPDVLVPFPSVPTRWAKYETDRFLSDRLPIYNGLPIDGDAKFPPSPSPASPFLRSSSSVADCSGVEEEDKYGREYRRARRREYRREYRSEVDVDPSNPLGLVLV